mmetsp:Transcript_21948/g.48536  ORF Transcript_21948/g.48536 Transcript_21948/m.48536 type:complete len:208 (-) Transcript_21948:1946-2569(-)
MLMGFARPCDKLRFALPTRILLIHAMENRFRCEHHNEAVHQEKACRLLETCQVRWATNPAHGVYGEGVLESVGPKDFSSVRVEHEAHAEDVNDAAAHEDHPLESLRFVVGMAEAGLTDHEQDQHQDHPCFAEKEGAASHAAPNEIGHENQHGVADDGHVLRLAHPLQGRGGAALLIYNEVLYEVVDAPEPVVRQARAPDQTVQELRE